MKFGSVWAFAWMPGMVFAIFTASAAVNCVVTGAVEFPLDPVVLFVALTVVLPAVLVVFAELVFDGWLARLVFDRMVDSPCCTTVTCVANFPRSPDIVVMRPSKTTETATLATLSTEIMDRIQPIDFFTNNPPHASSAVLLASTKPALIPLEMTRG